MNQKATSETTKDLINDIHNMVNELKNIHKSRKDILNDMKNKMDQIGIKKGEKK